MSSTIHTKRRKLWHWVTWGLGVGAVVLVLRSGVATSCYIPSSGMEQSLLPGDRILVSRWSYGLNLPFCMGNVEHRWGYDLGQRGDIALFHHPADSPERPIAQRPLFIGRLVGLPGDTLLVDSLFNLHAAQQLSPDCQQLYAYPPGCERQMDSLLRRSQLTRNRLLAADSVRHLRSFSRYELYLLQQAATDSINWLRPLDEVDHDSLLLPLVVPRKGARVKVTPWNITLLRNTLVLHEHRRATIERGELCVEGIPVSACTFTQDYYWVCTNNPVNLSDSRLFGFVPHSHLVGRATNIWFSQQPGHGLFGGYRWNRVGLPVR